MVFRILVQNIRGERVIPVSRTLKRRSRVRDCQCLSIATGTPARMERLAGRHW